MASATQVPRPPVPPPLPRPQRSLAGPIVLIIVGGIFLTGTMGMMPWYSLGLWFSRYWPLLIILWGVIKLVEYKRAQHRGVRASGIGVGGVFLLTLLIVAGLAATQAARFNWQELHDRMDMEGADFPFFGHTYSYDDTLAQNFPAGASLHVTNDRGAVDLSVSPDNQIHVIVRKRISSENQQDADGLNSKTKPQITVSGNLVTLNANTNGGGDHWITSDLDVALPRKAAVVIVARRGDVSLLGRDSDADITSQHGDISVSDVNGKVTLHVEHSSVRVSSISSDVSIEGHTNDVSVEDVKGELRLKGEFTESLQLARIAKTVNFKSSRTEMEFTRLDGELNLDSGDLQADNLIGPVRLETRSKDIRLHEVSGDVRLRDENGAVEVRMSKLGSMQLENRQGDIRLYVPDKAGFQVNAHVRNGEVQSDFGELKMNNFNDQGTASGTANGGGPLLILDNEHGTIEIRKGSSQVLPLPGGKSPKEPKAPAPLAPAAPAEVPQATEN